MSNYYSVVESNIRHIGNTVRLVKVILYNCVSNNELVIITLNCVLFSRE